ncbi:MAG: proline--tRNA ligase [Candidatus Aenigmarchaeota archaeon]|nr:proline--tRNA ligase [Candidatus Aenigmarchaeota archaeon]
MAEQEGITVKKSENFSEWYTQVVQKAELGDIRYGVKGFLVHLPWAVKIMKRMYKFIEKELEKHGHEPFLFPSVIPEVFLKKEKEHAEFIADVFWVTEGGAEYKKLEERLALRPTSETIIYPMFSLWIRSWRDLPLKTYQSCQVWRYESVTRPFIRGREFYWIEAHNAFATKDGAKKQVEEDVKITEETLYKKFCIPFLFFKRPEHDKFKGAVATFAADALMPDGRVIQLPSTHFLGQNFSKAFNVGFVDKDKKKKYVWSTCYGPAIWRILGAIIAIHGDDKGAILPPAISPLHVIIVPIYYSTAQFIRIMRKAKAILENLEKNKIRVKIDDRKEYTPGWKFNYWELKGVPLRIEIGPKDIQLEQVVLVRRDTGRKIVVKERGLPKMIKRKLRSIQQSLIERAEKFLKEHTFEVFDFEQLKEILERRGGIVKTEWCGKIECAQAIKEKTNGGAIRGTLFGVEEKPKRKCVYCGKVAKQVVQVAKQY